MKKYLNRDLSWIKFNARCLEESVNPDNPLLEQGKFISICQSNLDEFFMVRVGGLVRDIQEGTAKEDISGMKPAEQLSEIKKQVRVQVARQYEILTETYLPALEHAGIHFLKMKDTTKEQKEFLLDYFEREISPLLTPRVIYPKQPFPLVAAKSLHVSFLLPPKTRGGAMLFALVTLPASLPRVIMLNEGEGRARGVMLEEIVQAFAGRIFHVTPVACAPFRITRNTDFIYDDSNAETLIVEMRKNLNLRKWGKIVRLEIPEAIDNRLLTRLKRYFDVEQEDIYAVPGPLNPNYFMKQISSLEGFDDLRFTPFTPRISDKITSASSIFDAIAQQDLFFHHPYDSFDPVVRFLSEAASDPDVLAIKQTLYRVSGKSPIVAALSQAAQNGKQVTVLIEVRARFDEENNINWCTELEKVGCHVIYGVPNYKAHSKITLIIRKEDGALKRYVHLGTGNYNDATAGTYTDMAIMTADETICRDAGAFFNNVTGYTDASPLEKLVASPTGIRKKLCELIDREIENAEAGKSCGIYAKMNAMTDKKMIKRLYKAADSGVPVNLIIRGACCLKIGKHENIHVRSIVGRFLEHARVYMFENEGDPEVFLSSADMMTRNLDKRVELMFPVLDSDIRDRVVRDIHLELSDNVKAWIMDEDGNYSRAERVEPLCNAQETNLLG